MTWVVHTPMLQVLRQGAWVQIPKYRPGDVVTEQHLRYREILKGLGFRLSADGWQCRITQMMGPPAPPPPLIRVPEMVMTKPAPAPREPRRPVHYKRSTPEDRVFFLESEFKFADQRYGLHDIRLAEEICDDYNEEGAIDEMWRELVAADAPDDDDATTKKKKAPGLSARGW